MYGELNKQVVHILQDKVPSWDAFPILPVHDSMFICDLHSKSESYVPASSEAMRVDIIWVTSSLTGYDLAKT